MKATANQTSYIKSLFDDCGFDLKSANDFIQEEFGVKQVEELEVKQASKLIGMLKKMLEL